MNEHQQRIIWLLRHQKPALQHGIKAVLPPLPRQRAPKPVGDVVERRRDSFNYQTPIAPVFRADAFQFVSDTRGEITARYKRCWLGFLIRQEDPDLAKWRMANHRHEGASL